MSLETSSKTVTPIILLRASWTNSKKMMGLRERKGKKFSVPRPPLLSLVGETPEAWLKGTLTPRICLVVVVVDAGEVQQRAAMEFDMVINYIDLCVSEMIRIYNILHSSMMVDWSTRSILYNLWRWGEVNCFFAPVCSRPLPCLVQKRYDDLLNNFNQDPKRSLLFPFVSFSFFLLFFY